MWRKAKLITCLLCAGIAIAWLAARGVQAQNQAPADDPEATSLQAEIDELRGKVAELEERLSAIESRGGIQLLDLRETPHGRAVPRIAPRPPERTPQGEINGVPYYVIPLGKE